VRVEEPAEGSERRRRGAHSGVYVMALARAAAGGPAAEPIPTSAGDLDGFSRRGGARARRVA
jgi:hypothetical protein